MQGLKERDDEKNKGIKYPSSDIWQRLDGGTWFSSLGKQIVDDLKVMRKNCIPHQFFNS